MKNLTYTLFIVFILTSCDCFQCAEGTVRDATNTPLDSVKVTTYTKLKITEEYFTESDGKYKACTSNTGNCDGHLKIVFEKEGYETQEFTDPEYDLNILMRK